MKKFIITHEMLGSKDVVSILTAPVPESVVKMLETEISEDEVIKQPISHFLRDFNLVNTLLKKNKTYMLTFGNVEMTIANAQLLPLRVQRLIGPQVYALMKISPRLYVLSDIKRYLDSSVLYYMQTRGRFCPRNLLEATAFFLDDIDMAKETMKNVDIQDVTGILRSALRDFSAPLYRSDQSSLFHRAHQLDGHDIIMREAFDTILNDGTQEWSFNDPGSFTWLIDHAIELGYNATEVWAFKVLLIRKICTTIHWRHIAGVNVNDKDKINYLQYARDLGEEVRDYPSEEKDRHVSHIVWMIQRRLDLAEYETYTECDEDEKELYGISYV